nr:reverse transcriptase domain-containing protein [Tanacetum cinerariifolium]
ELIKRLHDKILKSIDEIMRVTTTFLKAGVADFSREQKKSLPLWKQQEAGQKQNFKKGGFQNQQRSEQKQDSDFISILGEEEGMEGLTTIKAEMGGHFVCHMCVDGGSTSEILYEYYFNRFHPEPADMTGVLRHIAKHRLNIREGCLPIRQKKKGQAHKRNKKKKKSDFQWIAEAKTAFKQMKKSIAKLPMLTAPTKKEELIIYLAAAKETISAVLMTEKDEKQVPIYFVSRALQGPKINYTPMERLIVALQILSNSKVTGRLLKWSFELEEHDIHDRPKMSVKGQILSDFIVKRPKDDPSDTPMEEEEELSDPLYYSQTDHHAQMVLEPT